MPPGKTLPDYVNYLWDRGRYQDALQVFDRKPPTELWALDRAMRGAILERLGRLDEARTEYGAYLQEATKSAPWGFLDVSERYRIPGSPLQQHIRFRRDLDSLPSPQSTIPRERSSVSVAADQRGTPCAGDDWFCKAEWYLLWAIHGETGCVDLAASCWGTWGGQRAVAYNIRHRVFVSASTRICFGRTEVCTELYAANAPLAGGDLVALARRYYYVIDQGYAGVHVPMSSAEGDEARFTGLAVIVNGNVPDPNIGGCMAGFAYGNVCEWGGGCTEAAGTWGTYHPRLGTIQFRAGKLIWQGGPSTTCQWPELVPSSTPGGVRCGEQCFIPAMWGATCPRFGWLETTAGCVGSDRRFWAPRYGNFYWRVFFPGGASDALLLFADVPASHPFFSWIMAVVTAGIDSACTADGEYYCPDVAITRAAMAGWLLRGLHGAGYQPPDAIGMFTDVSRTAPAAPWIEQLAREGITSGCNANPPMYCPSAEVTRGQMAVFLLRAKHGSTYQPAPAKGIFTDVPVDHPLARWIEQVTVEGIASGCSASPAQYCPNATVTRGQMAVFVARAFNLLM
jgi:hypothetical protein